MLPTGAGASKKIPIEGVEPIWARLLPGNKGFVVRADGKDGNPFLAVVGPDGGKPAILATEPIFADSHFVVSPDGDRVAYISNDHRLKNLTLAGAQSTTVPGDLLDVEVDLLVWSADGRSLFVDKANDPGRVDRLDLSTGRRELWKRLAPEDPTSASAASDP